MNHQVIEARELIAKAREALRRADKTTARHLGEQAALLAPDLEDAWLVLAASDPNPKDALAYSQKALQLNPQSTRAGRAVDWASSRLKQVEASSDRIQSPAMITPSQPEAATSFQKQRSYQTAVAMPMLKPQGGNWLLPALLIGAGCVVLGFFALFALTSPALASIVNSISIPAATQENLWASSDIAKPEVVPVNLSAFAPSAAEDLQPAAEAPQSNAPLNVVPTPTAAQKPTVTPTALQTEEPAATQIPSATETPGSMAMDIVADTPTSESVAPDPASPNYASGAGERWIDVDLTNQAVYAYEGDVVVNSFIVSTGTWLTPTVTGKYKIYVKIRSGNMHGPGYFLPDVPYIMYFYKGYGLHGTYWHNNFGTPMSHGCVNLRTDEAAWLFNWASVGTVVNVHY